MKINLSDIPLFEGIKEKDIEALLQCLLAYQKKYKKGETILREGDPTDCVGVVLSGMALITCSDFWGNNSVLGNAEPGAVFAEAYACIANEPLMVSISATQETTVLFLNVGKILTTCSNTCIFHAQLIKNLIALCAQKNLQLSRRILHTSAKTIRDRLLSYFSECSKKAAGNMFQIPYTRQQLADYLNVDRSAMCNELSKMQSDGLIRYTKNTVELLDES